MTTDLNSINISTITQPDVNVSNDCHIIDRKTTITWDNPQTLISLATTRAVERVRSVIMMPILYFIGLPGNVMNMAVFFKQGLRERIYLCLFSLALVDALYITFPFMLYAERMRGFTTSARLETQHFTAYMIDNNVIGLYGLSPASAFISTIIATERCACVLFPIRARRCIPTKILGVMMIVGVTVILSLRFVVTAKFHVACFYEMYTGKIVWLTTASQYYFQNKEMVDNLDGIFYGFCLAVGCPFLVLIATTVTAIKLQQTIRWRHRSSSVMSGKETGVTKMLIWLSVEFVILSVPSIILRVSPMFDPQLNIGGLYENTYKVLSVCADLCSYISSCVNFFVYYFTGSKYRETLHQMIGWKPSSLHS